MENRERIELLEEATSQIEGAIYNIKKSLRGTSNKFTLVYGDDGDFNSPTEAYEAAINHTLNELI